MKMDFRNYRCALSAMLTVIVCAGNTILLADVVIYSGNGTSAAFVLPEGSAEMLPGRSIVYQIPDVGCLRLHAETAMIVKGPTRGHQFARMLRQARQRRDVQQALAAADYALDHGMLDSCYQAASLAWRLHPDDAIVQRLVSVQRRMGRSLGSPAEAIKKFRQMVQRPAMRVVTSDHYVLMYDVSDSNDRFDDPAKRHLQLLEDVYRSYFLKFALLGEELMPPRERLMVLLFERQEDYVHYATMVDPNLRAAAGFWAPTSNIVAFVDQDSHQFHQAMRQTANALSENSRQLVRHHVKGSRDTVQHAATMQKLAEIMRTQSEIAIVTHEATHQLAGNTELMPRQQFALQWVHEGLATYFETPAGAGWGGIGAVNAHRLHAYRSMQLDRAHSNIEFIVSDLIFAAAEHQQATQAAYGQAWALTHFLMKTRFPELMTYYKRLSELKAPPGGLDRQELIDIFDEVFGDRKALEVEWRAYMSHLQTDTQQLLITSRAGQSG